MFDKLEALEERFQLVSEKISDPDIIADQESWRKYCKEHSDLTPIIDKYRELKSAKQTVADDKEMLEAGQDKEFEEMIRLEMAEAEETIERASEELKILLLPKDPNDDLLLKISWEFAFLHLSLYILSNCHKAYQSRY